MRKKIVAGNWKMNLTLQEGLALVSALKSSLSDIQKSDVVVCPPFPFLAPVADMLKGTRIGLGAQNMYFEEKGAYTGEVSAPMLLSTGTRYVIIGHSERRKYFGETSEIVNKKVKKAIVSKLTPIMCVGETLEQREKGETESIITSQVIEGLFELLAADVKKMIIAYEPIWAIGTGRTASPEQAVDVHRLIRSIVAKKFGSETAEQVRIQYGGSVKPDNAESLLGQPDIDGALVGGASLKADSFEAIVRAGELFS
ncbi:MAG: triose-phosphate isomerase [Calditrichaeota bacterium]|nr:triose-phosphate isomerase [Calditrichota bacterium]